MEIDVSIGDLIKKADLFIELGTKLKEFAQKPFLEKREDEMTEEELREFREFMGFCVLKFMEINK